jgi:hypothetical protein
MKLFYLDMVPSGNTSEIFEPPTVAEVKRDMMVVGLIIAFKALGSVVRGYP